MLRYRTVIYAGTVLTGFTGLIYQVVWQKYLSFLVGSEARSVALVVTVFLGGLAAGYRFWGRRTEHATSRRGLLRVYGFIELGIGLYAALFPVYLRLLTAIGHHGPSWLLTDLVVTAATLLLPTFLMGATIPLLVSVVPREAAEVHICHARIYGINTLGACLGAFGASMILIPNLGLHRTLLLASAVNLVVGTVFVLNPLRHDVAKDKPIEPIAHRFPLAAVYAYTLVTGAVTLSLEVLFVRVLGLTVGTGPHNFAIVVGVFIFGLAVGSLLVTTRLLSVTFLFRAVTVLSVYLMVLYLSVPYWPYWLSNARALLQPLPINYTVYLVVVSGFLLLILLPFLVPMGAMLPLVYALIPKGSADYGKKCGWVYFYNTLGTALGAICFSHLLLYVLDLDQVFKLDVLLLVALAVYLLARERRRLHAAVVGLLALGFVFLPGWDRASHYVGLYIDTRLQPFNFQGVFQKPNLASKVVFFEDGPDSTVTVTESSYPSPGAAEPLISRSLVINGKHDGDTLSDYSTITLAAMLPYFHAADRSDLRAAVVGLGTGVTASVLGSAEDVAQVTAVEISSTLVDSIALFDPGNRDLTANPKVEIIATDGFKYFTRTRDRLDIVVSATSPPWVVGVENLFTPKFYELAHDALNDDGVFLQWFPLYDMDAVLFCTILKNLRGIFPHLRLYRISATEMGILAGKTPLEARAMQRRFAEPEIGRTRRALQFHSVDQLSLISLFETRELDALLRQGASRTHTLANPGLAYASDRIRFVNPRVDWDNFVDVRVSRLVRTTDERVEAFARMLESSPGDLACTLPTKGPRLFCERYNRLRAAHSVYSLPIGQTAILSQIQSYDLLRQEGVVAPDPEFLGRAATRLVEGFDGDRQRALDTVFTIFVKDGLVDQAESTLSALAERGLITPGYRDDVSNQLRAGRDAMDRFVQNVLGD